MEDYEKKYKEALSRAATELETCGADKSLRNMIYAIFPDELKESEDERIRKELIKALSSIGKRNWGGIDVFESIAWLEKQGTPAKLSEEEQNRYAKVVLTSCAESFIKYLDAHKYEGKMCVSNGECEDIENAFHNAMWDRLHRYYCKYIEKQGEQKSIEENNGNNRGTSSNSIWSDEDDYNLQCMIAKVTSDIQKGNVGRNNELIDWLKSLKDRVQPKQEWSDEDENYLQSAENACEYQYGKNTSTILWLKHLKDRIGG